MKTQTKEVEYWSYVESLDFTKPDTMALFTSYTTAYRQGRKHARMIRREQTRKHSTRNVK